MSKRARPRRGEWRPPRPRQEILKAVAAAAVILGLTGGIIYIWPTGSSSTNTPATVTTSKPATTTTKKPTATTKPGTTTTKAGTTTTKAGTAP